MSYICRTILEYYAKSSYHFMFMNIQTRESLNMYDNIYKLQSCLKRKIKKSAKIGDKKVKKKYMDQPTSIVI